MVDEVGPYLLTYWLALRCRLRAFLLSADEQLQESFVFCLGLQSLVVLSAGAPGPVNSAEEAVATATKDDKCTKKSLEADGLYFYIAPASLGCMEAAAQPPKSVCEQVNSRRGRESTRKNCSAQSSV